MKKFALLMLILLLSLSLFAACAQTTAASVQPQEAGSSAASPSSAPEAGKEQTVSQPEGYPSKAIEFVVPAAAGAAMDLPTRVLVEVLDLGPKPVVVVNKPGATQTLGTQEVKDAPADGHTLLAVGNGALMIQPAMKELAYTVDDFRHLSLMAPPDPMVIVVGADSPYTTYADLEKALKSGAGLNYSAGNPGGVGDLAGRLWLNAIGVNTANFVPYTGSAECIAALMGGHVDFLVLDNGETIKRVEDGTLRALAITSDERTQALKDVPTLKELGIDGVEYYGYKWVVVHKDTPEETVAWIKQQIDLAISSEEYQSYMQETYGAPVELVTEKEMTKIVKDTLELNTALVKELGLAG